MSPDTKSPAASGPLFGRAANLEFLIQRAHQQGLTAVTGRAQIGKSRLLRQLYEDLSSQHDSLVGYSESTGESADVFLRALSDLYSRWLLAASYREQLKVLYAQHKSTLAGGTGQAIANIINKVTAIAKPALPIVGDLVREGISSLLDFNKELKSGGLELPRLSYEQARDLVGILAKLDQGPICLVLDGWDRSPLIGLEADLIETYLGHLQDWPDSFHIFLGVRDDPESQPAMDRVRTFKSSSATVALHDLGRMQLADDPAESNRLLLYLRNHVPSTNSVDETRLLDLIDGYPGVLQRWLQGKPETEKNLIDLAADAQNYRYREFDNLLGNLWDKPKDLRTLSIRVALFPQVASDDAWRKYEPILLGNLSADLVLDLQSDGVFEDHRQSIPTYGHGKRHDAAREWFTTRNLTKNPLPYARHEAQYLVSELTLRSPRFDLDAWPFLQALAALIPVTRQLELTEDFTALCVAAKSLSPIPLELEHKELLRRAAEPTVKSHPGARWLIEAGVLNASVSEGREGLAQAFDTLLNVSGDENGEDVLGKLYVTHAHGGLGQSGPPDDPNQEDLVLEDLRSQLAQNPEDGETRIRLAKAVYTAFMNAMGRGDRERTRALKSEACGLIAGESSTSEVRNILEMITETDMGS